MSVPAARIRTSSGWRDMAIQGAPGIPGYTPSAKAHSGAFAITADSNARFYTPPLTVDFNSLGGSPFANNGRFTVPVTGRYLLGFTLTELAQGTVSLGIILNSTTVLKRITAGVATGADGTKGGIELWGIFDLTAGHDVMQHTWSTGGGSTNILTIEAIRLDAPALNIVTNIPLVTSLPASPVDGQEVYYLADATKGVVWHLRYRAASASAYKWEVIAGPPMVVTVDADENCVSGTYGALTTPGPSITPPLAGEYQIEIGSQHYSDATGAFTYHSFDIGATAAVDGDGSGAMWIAGLNVVQSFNRTVLKTLAANTALVSKYKVSRTSNFRMRYMRVQPVRVG